MTNSVFSIAGCTLLSLCFACGVCAQRVTQNAAGLIRAHPWPVEARFNNPWPAEWERGFQERAHRAITNLATGRLGGTTYGESEKDMYPRAMFHFLAGHRESALKVLQQADAQGGSDHRHTLGIDYYWCFTIKGQIRKYFFLRDDLDPAYRQRMYDGAKIWTEEEPLRRPHPRYGKGDPTKGVWGPENKGSWVDVRDTDNLRAMRDTSVYLMAEETGNEATRQLYKRKIAAYVRMLYHTGMREWDSSNYHSHTLSPYHNLFDFAKDPEVKLLAKAALDWLYASGALKYYRGGFGGPRLRDYSGASVVFGGNAIHPLELYFGDAPWPDPEPDRDDLYQITSAYRPPQAVVLMAKKEFPRPVEILSSKPPYRMWEPGQEFAPRFHETLFIGETFQMGSMVSADPEKPWTPSVFNLMAFNSARGVDYFAANTTPIWEHSEKVVGDQVGQYRHLLIWLRPARSSPTFHFQIPKSARSEVRDDVWFVGLERTWLAVHPIQLGPRAELEPQPKKGDHKARYADERFFKAEVTGNAFGGFALEVGEACSFEEFKQAVRTKAKLDLSRLAQGTVELTGCDGTALRLTHNPTNDLPILLRNGTPHDWHQHRALYQPVAADGPISLGWQEGTLRIEAGGRRFEQTVTREGKVVVGH